MSVGIAAARAVALNDPRWLTGSPLQFQSRWNSFVQQIAQTGGPVDPDALVQYVLREAYLQTTEDLRFYAEKVKAFNAAKTRVRTTSWTSDGTPMRA